MEGRARGKASILSASSHILLYLLDITVGPYIRVREREGGRGSQQARDKGLQIIRACCLS